MIKYSHAVMSPAASHEIIGHENISRIRVCGVCAWDRTASTWCSLAWRRGENFSLNVQQQHWMIPTMLSHARDISKVMEERPIRGCIPMSIIRESGCF
jgi:hypothetical protein